MDGPRLSSIETIFACDVRAPSSPSPARNKIKYHKTRILSRASGSVFRLRLATRIWLCLAILTGFRRNRRKSSVFRHCEDGPFDGRAKQSLPCHSREACHRLRSGDGNPESCRNSKIGFLGPRFHGSVRRLFDSTRPLHKLRYILDSSGPRGVCRSTASDTA